MSVDTSVICSFCKKNVGRNCFKKHIQSHIELSKFDRLDIFIKCFFTITPKYFYKEFLEGLIKINIEKTANIRRLIVTWNSNCQLLEQFRTVVVDDVDRFFTVYLPWRKDNPNNINSKAYASILEANEPDRFYDEVIKKRNPYTGHDGRLSPWSKDFISYTNLSDEEKLKKISLSRKDDGKLGPIHKQYWMNKGFSEEEAVKKVCERQAVGSLENFKKRYGEVEGLARWKARQEKWMKSYKKSNYSKISQELFNGIKNRLQNSYQMFFATNGLNYNNEFILKTSKSFVKLDFFIPELNKVIEFDGDYWHGEARGNKIRDEQREREILEANPDLKIMHVKERDFRKDPDKIISECVQWLMN